jgi:hypothetical protein
MIDSIRIISAGLSDINARLADMMPGTDYDALEHVRNEVRAKLDYLTKLFFKESTQRFVDDNDVLVQVTNDMKSTLEQLGNMRNTLESAGRFLNAVNSLVQTVAPFG